MTVITGAKNSITVADPPIPRGGFLTGATVIDVPDGDHSLLGFQYETLACIADVRRVGTDWCATGTGTINCATGQWIPPSQGAKTFSGGMGLIEGAPFALYAGVECNMQRIEESSRQASKHFDYAERKALDVAMMAFVTGFAGTAPITATVLPPALALGLAEAWAQQNYGGTPLIIIPMEIIGVFCESGLISPNLDGSFTSCNGSTVISVLSGNLNSRTIYATGRIVIARGPIKTYTAPPQLIPCPDGKNVLAPARALAERIYVPSVECDIGSIVVQPCACTSTAPATGGASAPPPDLPELGYLSETAASVSDPDFTLHVHGEHLDDDTTVLVNGNPYPTSFIDDHELEIVVHPSTTPAGSYTIRLQSPAGLSVQTLNFTLTP